MLFFADCVAGQSIDVSGSINNSGPQWIVCTSLANKLLVVQESLQATSLSCVFSFQITGDTVYNLMKIGELETDKEDRPVDPPKIVSVEVI